MIKPTDIADALVALLRAIPDLVDEMGGDEQRISAYPDVYPYNVDLQKAVHDMPSPSILIAYRDWGEGSMGKGQPINHLLTIFLRPGAESSYSDLTTLLINGIPAGQPLAMINAEVHADLDPMRIEGRCGRQQDAEGVEYWELNISLNEKWG